MSPMICRVMAAILMLPLAAVVYVIAFAALNRRGPLWLNDLDWILAGSLAWAFIAVYWWLIWRRAIVWTAHRKNGTVLATLEAIAIAAAVGFACRLVYDELAYWSASVVAPLSWLLLTVYAWRETRAERGPRAAESAGPIACPECDYDLTGLKGTRCPECGTEFTLDELVGPAVERLD